MLLLAFHKVNKRKGQQMTGQPTLARVTIPYISALSERIKNSYKSFGIATSFKPINKLRDKLLHVKDKTVERKTLQLSLWDCVR